MRNKVVGAAVAVVVVVLWIFWGRFAVEGGKVPWALINGRNDVLKEALAANPSQSQKEEGLWRAVHKANAEAIPLLVAAGADPNKVRIGDNCLLEYPTTFAVVRALVEAGAAPEGCRMKRDDFVRWIVGSFGTTVSEPELIAFLQLLGKRGYPTGNHAIASAEKAKLDKVVAYLRNPSGVAVGKVQTLALLGREDASVSHTDLRAVCRGEGVADAAAYQKDPERLSPAYAFELRDEEPRDASNILPRWWIADRLQHTQVVACAIVRDKRVAKECKYQGGVSLFYYTATYDLSIREAKTATQLAQKRITLEAAPPETCTMFKMGGTESVYPDYAPELIALLKDAVGARD